jgi:hypothetical protein
MLGERPGLVVVDVLVGLVSERHDLAYRLAEFPRLEVAGDVLAHLDELRVEFRLGAVRCEHAVEALVDEPGAAAGDIDHLADQVAVDAQDEIGQVEIQVIDAAAQPGREIIAQVFGVQVVQVAWPARTGHGNR